MMRLYKKQRKDKLKQYIKQFSEIIKCIQHEIIENYENWCELCEEEDDEEEVDYKDEEIQTE